MKHRNELGHMHESVLSKKRDKNDMMYGVLHTEVHVVVMYGVADEQVLSTTTHHTATTVVAIHTSYTKYANA